MLGWDVNIAQGVVFGAGHAKGSKQFFFEKKNQKTFVLDRRALETPRTQDKRFLADFFKKATSCLPHSRGTTPSRPAR
jgi:hypothetical protein